MFHCQAVKKAQIYAKNVPLSAMRGLLLREEGRVKREGKEREAEEGS